jgi:hypothetical protein
MVSGRRIQSLYRDVLLNLRKIGAVAIQGFEYRAMAASSQVIDEDIPVP